MTITILIFGITVLLNKIASDLIPNHTLAGWPGALTCIATSVITTFLAFYLAVIAEDLINDFYHKKTQSNLVSEDSNHKETQTNLENEVTVEVIRPIAVSSNVSH